MKSIKEKAEEYENSIGSQDYCYLDIYDSYEAGANNVLDEIEKLLPKEDNNLLNDYGKALVCRIKDTIEQLRK